MKVSREGIVEIFVSDESLLPSLSGIVSTEIDRKFTSRAPRELLATRCGMSSLCTMNSALGDRHDWLCANRPGLCSQKSIPTTPLATHVRIESECLSK